MFVHAVVVGNNRTCAEAGFAADFGITNVGEVVGFGAFADGGVFDFDEVADMYVVGKVGLRTQTGVRADSVVFADFAVFEVGEEGRFCCMRRFWRF